MSYPMDYDEALDFALQQLSDNHENGNSVTLMINGKRFTIRRVSLAPFIVEVTNPAGERRTFGGDEREG